MLNTETPLGKNLKRQMEHHNATEVIEPKKKVVANIELAAKENPSFPIDDWFANTVGNLFRRFTFYYVVTDEQRGVMK